MKSGAENVRAVVAAICTMSWLVCAHPATASITAMGDINPTYDGSDPWSLAGDLVVGAAANANLVVSGGSQVTSMDAVVAEQAGSTAVVTITDADSRWSNWNRLEIGAAGDADLVIRNGGLLSSVASFVATAPGGTGTIMVTGVGSELDSFNFLVGQYGQGGVAVVDGGCVSAGHAILGMEPGSSGSAVVRGSGSIWDNAGLLDIGYRGDGQLMISDGGRVTSANGRVGMYPGSTGSATVTGPGSQWQTSQTLYVGGNEEGPGGTAFLDIRDHGLVEAAAVTIWSPGIVAGDGTLKGEVVNHGTIRPGGSIGALTVDGGLTLASGGLLEIEIDNDGNSDKVLVTGEFVPGIGHVKPVPIETISGQRQYTVVEAGSILWPVMTVVDSFDTALLRAYLTHASFEEPNVAILRVMPIPFDHPGIAQTNNQRSLGLALQQIAEQGGNALTLALQQVETIDQVRSTYDQVSGQTTPSLAPISIDETTKYVGMVSDRLRATRMDLPERAGARAWAPANGWEGTAGTDTLGIGTGQYAFALGNGTPYLGDEPWGIWGIWGNGYGLFGSRQSKSGVPGYQDSIYGAGVGLDYRFTPQWLLGLTGGYADGSIHYAASRNSSDITSTHVGLYGAYDRSDWYLHSILAYADLDYETHRFVDLTGERLDGEPSGHALTGYLEGGRNWAVEKVGLVRPLASIQLSSLHVGSFTETGGADSLHFGANSYQSCRGSLGVELIRQLFEHADGCRMTLDLRGRWVHEFGDRRAAIDAQFVGEPGVVFRVSDAAVSRDSALLGAGLNTWFSRATGLSLDYGVELNRDNTIHAVSAGLEHRW